jgi:hypothetical protein
MATNKPRHGYELKAQHQTPAWPLYVFDHERVQNALADSPRAMQAIVSPQTGRH